MSDYTPTTEEVRGDYAHFQTPSGVTGDVTEAYADGVAEFNRWLVTRDAEVAQKARAEGWDAARAEVRLIPCWFNSETGQGGFDLQHGEIASEEGAWMEVTRVLGKNPYKEQEEQS